MSSIAHFDKYSIVDGNVKVTIDLSRFKKQFRAAQWWLDTQIMHDMLPYMPMQTGTLIQTTSAMSRAIAGTGKVVAAAPPYGRFQYMGKVMVDEKTRSPWAREDAKKVVTDRDLTYSNPKATPEWFETAKENDGKAWVKGVKKIAGGVK